MSDCIDEPGRRASKTLANVVAPHEQVEKPPFRGRVRRVLGSEVDGNGIGGRIFNRRAGGVAAGWGIWYRRRRVGFGGMAWVVGSGENAHYG